MVYNSFFLAIISRLLKVVECEIPGLTLSLRRKITLHGGTGSVGFSMGYIAPEILSQSTSPSGLRQGRTAVGCSHLRRQAT